MYMKTKKRNCIFLAVLMIWTAMMMTACVAERDNAAAQTPLGYKIVGKWYAETPKQVTIGTGENAVECAKVVLVGTFDADGKGFWSYILVDKQNRAIQPVGKDGKEHPYWANCQYSVTGNTVNMELTANYLPTSQMEWTFNYNGTYLQTKYEDRSIDLHPITTGEDAMYQEWMQQLGFGASADNDNSNDKDITAQNWRKTEAIYIYDGVGVDVKDEKGRTGYTTVNLPWYKGDKLTNLPEGFCDDITPEMGWEWVLNRCGSRVTVNNNFFAVYNKYTGILRFFYYMPQSNVNTGNDHVWQVSMTDNLATHTTIPYGVPNDRKITNKGAITQDANGTYVDYVTPWTDYLSDDRLIVPNVGWWAFDVDLSLTRPETINEDDNIKLQMRSWNNNHISLYSTILSNINGELKAGIDGQAQTVTKTPLVASSSKGLFGRIGDLVKLGTKVKDAVTNLYSGNVIGAIKGGVDLAKTGSSLASGKIPASGGETTGTAETTFGANLNGTINMTMYGTINTDGAIHGSAPTVGIASPTFYLKDFDTKNSHLGQGVWNLKKTPMVYATNSINLVDYYLDLKNYHYSVNWTFFDPSSIEVELNPDVFPESEIEWMQVDAVAGIRRKMAAEANCLDPFRQAIGLAPVSDYLYNVYYKPKNKGSQGTATVNYGNDVNDYVFNFVGAGDFNGQTIDGMKYRTDFFIPAHTAPYQNFIFGCGIENDYIIEPQVVSTGDVGHQYDIYGHFMTDGANFFPMVEINVTVQVKLKSHDAPILLSRIYLPDYQYLEINESETKVLEVIDRIYAKKNLSPKTKGHTQSYDFQAARINKCFKLLTGYSR